MATDNKKCGRNELHIRGKITEKFTVEIISTKAMLFINLNMNSRYVKIVKLKYNIHTWKEVSLRSRFFFWNEALLDVAFLND